MNAIEQFLYDILSGINSLVGNYGVAIIIFTMLMRLIIMPFDYKSRKGMRKMALIQPKINELQKKYGKDQQKLQQKQAELMKKEGYNPLSGCLPLLLTWPIMFAMFAAMRAIANEQMAMQTFRYLAGETDIIAAADRFLWVKNIWMADSLFASIAPNAQALNMIPANMWQRAYEMLSEGQLQAVTESIAAVSETVLDFSTTDAVKTSVTSMITALGQMPGYVEAVATVPGWTGLNFFLFSITLYKQYNGLLILPVLAGVSQVLQYKFNPALNENQQPQQGNAQSNGMNNFMKYFFPILSVFWCLTSNAGFAVYWVTSTIAMWIQSVIITKILEKQDARKALSESVSGEGSIK
ncbi:MAG: YidC/Oxa1 family membrane protein insertase [Clostridia bacterium]|nr:YidC/Oxa1 family membrane protein insertase [Clostridia bacterium]